MFKLAPPRAYARYQYFSFELSATSLGAVVCPLPNCCNFPFVSDQVGTFLRCPYCLGFFCVECKLLPIMCRCEKLRPDKQISLPTRPGKTHSDAELSLMGMGRCPIQIRIADRRIVLEDVDACSWTSRQLYYTARCAETSSTPSGVPYSGTLDRLCGGIAP